MKRDQSGGCIEIEVPYVTLHTCEKLDTDQVIYVSGTAKREGIISEENIQVQMKKKENKTVSLSLYSESMGCILQDKLKDQWHCVLECIIFAERTRYIVNEQANVSSSELQGNRERKTALMSPAVQDSQNYNDVVLHASSTPDRSDSVGAGRTPDLDGIKIESENWLGHSEGRNERVEECNSCASGESYCQEMSDEGPAGSDHTESNDGHSSRDLVGSSRAARMQKPKLMLACKFCLKPFCKGKNPLMNLQKHVMKRCPVLHPKQSTDDSNSQPSERDDRGQLFVCYYCHKPLSTKYNRDRHIETCQRNPNNKADLSQCTVELFYCDECNWPTRTELDLHKHKVQNHGAPKKPRKKLSNPKPVACRYCGELFKFTSSRCNHERFKCPKNLNITKSFFCRYCGTRCCSREALDAHTEQKHRDKKCVCKLCGAEFNTRNSKWHHVLVTHRENPRRFACTHCSKTYINKRMLLQHMTKHFDERKVQCTICGKCFKNQIQEKSHRKHIHEGRYRFHCSKCGHGVARQQYLQSHKCGRVRRIQDGEKAISETKSNTTEQQQQQKEESQLLQSAPNELNNTNLLTPQLASLKPTNDQLAHDMENETLYYNSQQTLVFSSFTQTLSDSRGVLQMPNLVTQPVSLNNYMPNCGILPYPNPNPNC